MYDGLEEEDPEAAPSVREAVREHGEKWVIENYFPEIASPGVMMDVSPVEELPFVDDEEHDVLTEQERRERAEAYREYRENLRSGNEPGGEWIHVRPMRPPFSGTAGTHRRSRRSAEP